MTEKTRDDPPEIFLTNSFGSTEIRYATFNMVFNSILFFLDTFASSSRQFVTWTMQKRDEGREKRWNGDERRGEVPDKPI